MNRKVYVASKLRNKEKVAEVQEFVKSLGWSIAYDWASMSKVKPYTDHIGHCNQRAKAEIDAIVDSKIFILLLHNEIGSGMYTEFGAALASSLLTNKPHIFVVYENKEQKNNCLFHFHPFVQWCNSLEKLKRELNNLKVAMD